MMQNMQDEWEFITTHEIGREAEAAELVATAWEQIEHGYPNNPKVHAKRVSRARRLSRLGKRSLLVNIVAQWLSAKARAEGMPKAKSKKEPSWQQKARAATERVASLADEVEELRQHLALLSEALRYEGVTEDGREISGKAQVAASCLAEALPALRFAQEIADQSLSLMPAGARGAAGIVGALREGPPDEALVLALCRAWKAHGLSLAGGEDGDGIDRFVAGLLGEKAAKKALTEARARLSTEIGTQ